MSFNWRHLLSVVLATVAVALASTANAQLVGLWEFEESGNLTAATVGTDLALTNPNGTEAAIAGTGTALDAGAAQLGVGDYYTVTHGIAPNGGGSFVNQYSLLYDISYPAESFGTWRSIFQTNQANSNDGEYFGHPSDESWGVSELGYTDGGAGTFFSTNDTWYRMVLTFDLGNAVKVYVDGNFIGDHNPASLDGRFSLDPTFLIFADNDGEDNLMNVSNFAVWDGVLSPGIISALAGPGAQIQDLVPTTLGIVIDRDFGTISMQNNTGFAQDIKGYSIISEDGALIEANATFFADTDPNWIQFTADGATSDLSEGHLTTGSIADTASISLGDAWLSYYLETSDIKFEYLNGNGELVEGDVSFTGTTHTNSFAFGDLDFDGDIDGDDWVEYVNGLGADLSGLSIAVGYREGDLTGDGVNDYADYLAFKGAFDAVNGAGSFDAMVGVPEPSAIALIALFGLLMAGTRRLRIAAFCAVAIIAAGGLMVGDAQAQLPTPSGLWDFDNAGDLTAAAIGNDLVLVGSQSAVAGIGGGDGAASIGVGSHWQAAHGIPANGPEGAGFVNEFTLVFDVLYPQASVGTWRAFFQTNNTNSNDADYFIAPGDESWGVSALGYTNNPGTGEFFSSPSTWYRAVMSVKHDDDPNKAFFNLYINGVLAGTHNPDALGIDGRFTLYGSDDPNPIVIFSGDNDGEDAEMHYSNIGIWDRPLTPLEAAALGGPDAAGIDLDALVSDITLEVNKDNGIITMINESGVDMPEEINFYEIRSIGGALDADNWISLDEQNFDADGPGIGQSWNEGGGSDANLLTEAFLLGSSLFEDTDSVSLDAAYDTSVFGEDDGDLKFYFGLADSEVLVEGTVEYVTGGEIGADFNNDGIVDGDDFLIWQRGFGDPGTHGDGDANFDGFVDGDDFLVWQQQFGGPPSGNGSTAVPEPSTLGLVGFLLVGLSIRLFRRKRGHAVNMVWKCLACAIIVAWATTTSVYADSENDREYWLGDADGAIATDPVSVSIDSKFTITGDFGDQQNLSPSATAPTYVDVGPNGLVRPGAGNGELGVAFDAGDGSYLFGDRLGLPETSAASFGGDVFGPLDYGNIVNRGFQLWVRPGGGTGLQDVVMDTDQHGLRISEAGTWTMRYDGSDVDSQEAATPNDWAHVMVVRPFGASGPSGGARLYVDGYVIAAGTGDYDGADNFKLVLGANTGDDVETLVGQENFFTGVLDNLEMFVMGESEFGTDYGTFNPAEDNEIIAAALVGKDPADVNLDGAVNMIDVDDFVSYWLTEQTVNGIRAGDLASREQGDLNFDGITNLADWSILNAANPSAGAAIMSALGGVPEPSTVILLGLGMVIVSVARRRPQPSLSE